MRRALRSGSRRGLVLAVAWGALFALLLGLRLVFQRTEASPPHPQAWLRIGSVALLVLLTMAAVLGQRVPWVGTTRLLGLGTQPDPGRAEQVLIALLGVHAVGAIVVSDELSTGTPPWRTGLWGLALSFAALTLSVLAR
jgi:hypothetical protein